MACQSHRLPHPDSASNHTALSGTEGKSREEVLLKPTKSDAILKVISEYVYQPKKPFVAKTSCLFHKYIT